MNNSFSDFQEKRSGAWDALYTIAEQEARYKAANPFHKPEEQGSLKLLYELYGNVIKAYRKSRLAEDKEAVAYLRHERAKMNFKLNPNLATGLILALSTIIRLMDLNLFGGKTHRLELKEFEKQQTTANNLAYVDQSIKKAGFNISMEGPLKKMMEHNLDSFHLRYFEPRFPNVDFTLHFKKIGETGQYYFDRFEAASRQDFQSRIQNASSVKQNFNIYSQVKFSAEDAANLVANRPVAKQLTDGTERWFVSAQGQAPKALSHSFNVAEQLSRLPIQELKTPGAKRQLIDTLRKGGAKEVTLKLPGGSEKHTISLNRSADGFHFHDTFGKLVDMERRIRPDMHSLRGNLHKAVLNPDQAPVHQIGHRHRG